ncbi:hypothetical protein GGX14DRAFT_405635, partial [Mycena pura]
MPNAMWQFFNTREGRDKAAMFNSGHKNAWCQAELDEYVNDHPIDKTGLDDAAFLRARAECSNRPFTFTNRDKADLAIKSDNQCSICRDIYEPEDVGRAAHYIAASEAHEVLHVALTYNIVSPSGPQDLKEALDVNIAQGNGIW